MNEKIKNSIDKIEPESRAKERMYQNILKKAAKAEKPKMSPAKARFQRSGGGCEPRNAAQGGHLNFPSRKEERPMGPVEPSRDCCVKA